MAYCFSVIIVSNHLPTDGRVNSAGNVASDTCIENCRLLQ